MRALGKWAIALASIFVVFMVAGIILASVGGTSVIKDEGVLDKIENFLGDMGVYVDEDFSETSFERSFVPEDGLESVKISETGIYKLCLKYSDDDKISVSFDGDYPIDLIEKYNLSGLPFAPDLGDEEVSETDVSASDAESPISFKYNNGELTIVFDAPKSQFGTGIAVKARGTITVTLPDTADFDLTLDSVAGDDELDIRAKSLSLNECAGDLDISGTFKKVKLNECAGDINVDGDFVSFEISECAGDIDLKTGEKIKAESFVRECAGDISIVVAEGTKLNVKKSSCLGVDVDDVSDSSARVPLELSNCAGEVSVKTDD